MLRRTFYTLSAALAVAAAPHFTSAADEPAVRPEHATLFKSLDKDGDGKIGVDEVPQEQRRLLERLLTNNDKDKDGKLTIYEFGAGLSEGRPQGDAGARRPEGGPPAGQRFNPEEMFKRMDANGDGKVKPDEVGEERREQFKQILSRVDADKDGAATLDEFRKGFAYANPQPNQTGLEGPNSMEQVFKTLDADGNGALSKEELSKAAEALAKLDKNGDGSVSREEAMPRPGQPQPGQPGRPDGGQMLAYMMRQDTNGDKAISKEEAGERLKENFDRIDRNSDGKLDETELKQMVERMQQAGGNPPPGRRPEGAPKPEGAKPDGEKKPEARRPEGDRKPEGERKPEGDRKPKSDDAPKKE
jgi:Ca2+-binding EF-hand superfamily protein